MRRRIQRLAIAVTVVTALSVAASAQASAAGETIGGCILEKTKEVEELHGSIHNLEKDVLEDFEEDLETCLEAPSPILPELDEIIWGGAAFLILLAFMIWKGFPAVKRAMDARSEKIRSDLDAADKAKSAAQQTQAEYENQLADAKSTAAQITDEARVQATKLGDELRARAEAEIAEQRAKATADIEASRLQAIDDLRGEVSAIAVAAAERVVGASLDEQLHRRLIDSYIDELAGSGSNGSGSNGSGSNGSGSSDHEGQSHQDQGNQG